MEKKQARIKSPLKLSGFKHVYMFVNSSAFEYDREIIESQEDNASMSLDLGLNMGKFNFMVKGESCVLVVEWEARVRGLLGELDESSDEDFSDLNKVFEARVGFDHVYNVPKEFADASNDEMNNFFEEHESQFRPVAQASATNSLKNLLSNTPLAGLRIPYGIDM
ncbi:hypothetical protein [Idiomarina aminovorans]|uniref:hypothetical protein n=1 Tax=Idiomarina aminovorans TaxID=2914829 RepID=UPI0020036938|nr:hypothetical protein [Idiomarina sp. ATCH4]MCK7458506.1 hypothetical protein [Idiomarina sp. ATCH4]